MNTKIFHRINYMIIVALFAAGITSCDKDLLETIPGDRISSTIYWQTPNDALLAVNSLYNDLEGVDIFSYDALTDIAHTNDPFGDQPNIEKGIYDALNPRVQGRWAAAYKGIAAANYFLENVDKVTFTDEALPKQYKAEARVLRAYQYLRLVPLYGDVPLIKNSLTLDESRKSTRTPAAEVWNFVDQELEAVSNGTDLPESYDAKNKGRITKWAALGLKARAALYAGNYRKAADAAALIINSGQFSLYPTYAQLFSYAAENSSEVLLDKQFIKDLFSNNAFAQLAPYSQKNANSAFVPTKKLVDIYQTAAGKNITDAGSGYDADHPYANRDPRLHFSIFLDGDVLPSGDIFHPAPNSGTSDAAGVTYHSSTTGLNIKKYVNAEDYANISNSGINIILLRYAEVLLTYAEAKIELGEVDQTVYNAINLVRNGRDDVKLPDVTAATQTAAELKELVRNERAVELSFEGLRLADIRRWKIAETVVPGEVQGLTYVDDDGTVKVVQVVSGKRAFRADRDYLWPIPQKERDQNPNLTQNPNW